MATLRSGRCGPELASWILAGSLAAACSAGGGASAPPGGGGSGGNAEPMPTSDPMGTGAVPTATGAVPGTGGFVPVTGGAGGTSGAGGAPPGGAPTGGAGATPSTGGTTQKEPFAGYDPTVQFNWEETTPQLGSCKAGQYTGSFAGTYTTGAIVFPFPVPIAGNVTHRLEAASTGEFFEIRDGSVEGTADTPVGPVPFSADFTGELDCENSVLVGAYLRNGQYTLDGGATFVSFDGPVEGMYDRIANQFVNGTWVVGEPTYSANPPPLYGGNGTWGSQWTGP